VLGLAWLNLANGDFRVLECDAPQLAAQFERLRPAEVLIPDGLRLPLLEQLAPSLRRLADWQFDAETARRLLTTHFGTRDLAGFGADEMPVALAAAAALFDYARATQRQALAHITALTAERDSAFLRLDAATRRNLEITETLRGEARPPCSRCSTPAPPAWARAGCATPCTTRCATARRGPPPRGGRPSWAKARWSRCGACCAACRTWSGSPPGWRCAAPARGICRPCATAWPPAELRAALGSPRRRCCSGCSKSSPRPTALDLLTRAIAAEPSTVLRDGGVIAEGFDADLDELRGIQTNCGAFLLELEARERSAPASPTSRSSSTGARLLHRDLRRQRRQGRAARRLPPPPDPEERRALHHPELKAFEDKALSAQERAWPARSCSTRACSTLAADIPRFQRIARACALLDGLAAFAEAAARYNYAMPVFSDQPGIEIRRPPPGGGAAGGKLHRQRLPPRPDPPHAAHHRPQHGR
jgi:DNA mismatch repair protein MutS